MAFWESIFGEFLSDYRKRFMHADVQGNFPNGDFTSAFLVFLVEILPQARQEDGRGKEQDAA